MSKSKCKWTDQEFIEAVKSSLSYADVLRKLNLKIAGSNYDTVKKNIKKFNLDTSHMTGSAWNQGAKYKQINPAQNLSKILVQNSTWTNTYHLKNRLFKEGIKEQKCECCGLTEWQGMPIALELHHVNGIKNDLRIENLQILCPNCHALTDNYRGKSKAQSAQQETAEVEAG